MKTTYNWPHTHPCMQHYTSQREHSSSGALCVSFPPYGPVRPGSSQEAKSQTCFGKKREDVFLYCPVHPLLPWLNVITQMISSHLIIVNNIISLTNGLENCYGFPVHSYTEYMLAPCNSSQREREAVISTATVTQLILCVCGSMGLITSTIRKCLCKWVLLLCQQTQPELLASSSGLLILVAQFVRKFSIISAVANWLTVAPLCASQ